MRLGLNRLELAHRRNGGGGGAPPALTLVSPPSLPNPTYISQSNVVTPAVWSQAVSDRTFSYYNGVSAPPASDDTTGFYRTGNTSLTHTPQPDPHPDSVSVNDTIWVRERPTAPPVATVVVSSAAACFHSTDGIGR